MSKPKSKYSKEEVKEARDYLLSILPPGAVVYTVLNHVARSGMSRSISLCTIIDNAPYYITGYAARVLNESRDKYDGITVGGCGMDTGFSLVYNLSWTLYKQGFGIEGKSPHGHKNRPDTKEKAALLVSKGYIFHGRNGDTSGWDSDGGYALTQRWL